MTLVTQKQKNNRKKPGRFFALFLSTSLVAVFAMIQVIEMTKGDTATDTDQVTLTTDVQETISLDCGADVIFPDLTPGTAVTGTSVCTVTTNAELGYDLKVKRDGNVAGGDTTMDKTDDATVNIADRTAWDPTAGAGAGNATVWDETPPAIDESLGFTVFASTATKNTTWWGTGAIVTDPLNKYAGFPYSDATTYYTIMDHDAYSGASTTTSIGYKLNVPGTQKSGSYDGTVTYQVVTKP